MAKSLGKGSYGVVYAHNGKARKKYKEVACLGTTLCEAAMLTHLRGTGCVVDITAATFPLYIDMSQGVPLSKCVKPQSREVVGHLLSALQYLHDECRIAHGDVTPANVLMVGGRYVLCDLGTARFIDIGGHDQAFTGATTYPWYRPPEIEDDTVVDQAGVKRIDLWGCGVIMVNVVTDSYYHELSPEMFGWLSAKEQALFDKLCAKDGGWSAADILSDEYFEKIGFDTPAPARFPVTRAPTFAAPKLTGVLFKYICPQEEWGQRKATTLATACNLFNSQGAGAEACLYVAIMLVMRRSVSALGAIRREAIELVNAMNCECAKYVPHIEPPEQPWDWDSICALLGLDYDW